MRYVQLEKIGQFDTRSIVKMVLNIKVGGMMLEEMRRRLKIADLFDEVVRTEVPLDEEQFKLVAAALNTYPYGGGHKDLLAIIDGILDAPEQSRISVASGGGGGGAAAAA